MATNVSEETSNAIQELVHDAFDTNSILDRVKTELNTTLAFPVTGNLVHMLAHKYSLDKGYRDWETDRKSTRLNSSHITRTRMPSSA